MELNVSKAQNDLMDHPMYRKLNSLENIKIFMKYHVFAVWDFMSLLKSLQREITCVELPWTDSSYDPELIQLINEIVLGEESDQDHEGNVMSHFALYLKAMKEIGADTELIDQFLKDFNFEILPTEIKEITAFHLNLAMNGKVHEVASSFFFGREKLIPEMFDSIVSVLKDSEVSCPSLIYYLERHIEVDSEDHGPKALKCLKGLMDTELKKEEVESTALRSLTMRNRLWDFILSEMSV